MKNALYVGWLGLLMGAAVALLILEGPVPPAEPVQLAWPATSDPPPPLALQSLRTMNETAFFKVCGVLHNRGVEPVGPVAVWGRFTSRSDGAETSAMAFAVPEIILPGAAARFELVVADRPESDRVDMDFRLLTGEALPVDGTLVETGEAGAP
ncbi:MAG: hypothetical protein AB7V14_02690 [Kiritimatiellia bacterium]